ncbi:type VII secretion system-associated protein [Amycolatopsis japonica]
MTPDQPPEPATSGEPEADKPLPERTWVFLIDPAWQPLPSDDGGTAGSGLAELAAADPGSGTEAAEPDAPPPLEVVVGGWLVDEDGSTGRFHANPDYVASQPGSPTDPVDAVLQLVTRGEADTDLLLETIKEAHFGVAVSEQGNPLIADSPDGVTSVLVTTAPAHRSRIEAAAWMELSASDLAAALPDDGVDVLLNPGAEHSMRLLTPVLKRVCSGAEADAVDVAEERHGRPGTDVSAPAEGEAVTGTASR